MPGRPVIGRGLLDALDESREEVGRLEEVIESFRAEHGAAFEVLDAFRAFHSEGTSATYESLVAALNNLSVAHKAADPHY